MGKDCRLGRELGESGERGRREIWRMGKGEGRVCVVLRVRVKGEGGEGDSLHNNSPNEPKNETVAPVKVRFEKNE